MHLKIVFTENFLAAPHISLWEAVSLESFGMILDHRKHRRYVGDYALSYCNLSAFKEGLRTTVQGSSSSSIAPLIKG
jgi:hypothetical protein